VHFVTKFYIILDCPDCLVPLAIWAEHGKVDKAGPRYSEMVRALIVVGDRVFGHGKFILRTRPEGVYDHAHIHIDPQQE